MNYLNIVCLSFTTVCL